MGGDRFELILSALEPEDADSLERQLRRAAIRMSRRRCADGSVTVASRRNGVFSADDVLEVVAEWIEQRPDRMARASIVVRRSPSNDGFVNLPRRLARALAGAIA